VKRTSIRLFAATAMVSIAAMTVAGCAQSSIGAADASAAGSKKVTVFISGDTNVQDLWQKSLVPAFEKAHPGYAVTVNLDLHGQHDSQTMAKLTSATKQKKDPGFDLVDAGFVPQASQAGLLTKVSSANLAGLSDVPPAIVTAAGVGGIPYRGSSVLLAYDTTTVATPPKTLDALLAWIKANPGKFTYNTPDSGGSGQAFVTTVLDKYVSAGDRKKMVAGYEQGLESKWDKGFQTLAALNPYIYQKGVYPNGNDLVLSLLASGQISMAPVWSDQFITGQKNGQIPATVGYTQISNPSLTGGAAYLGIPKASTHQAAALTLANWVLGAKAQALMASSVSGYPVIPLDKLPADVQKQFASTDTATLRPAYFSSMAQDLNNQWTQKVPGK
jgi:putative spermidine/putrescine transport system substrate-binding protein